MARKLDQIQAGIIADVQAQPELAALLTSPSRRAIWRLWTFVQASAILLLEQLMDVFQAETEAKIAKAIPGTRTWLSQKVSEFQYSATNPQVVQLVDLAPQYPVTDASLRIITRNAVITTIAGTVIIKAAKNEPPEALSTAERNALQSYVETIGTAFVNYVCTSTAPDQLYLDIEVYYDGQYSTVIAGTVNNAIDVFLAKLPFNGLLKLSDLEFAIRSVIGVNDVLLKNVKVRADATAFLAGTFLVQNNTVISRLFPTIAGYVVRESTTTNIITFIAT